MAAYDRFYCIWQSFNPFYNRNPKKGALANSEDPADVMQQNVAFHQGLYYLLYRQKPASGNEIRHYLEILSCGPLLCTINHAKFIYRVKLFKRTFFQGAPMLFSCYKSFKKIFKWSLLLDKTQELEVPSLYHFYSLKTKSS